MAIIQIPVLFDMSGDTITYGEEVSGDFIHSHLNFMLDMTTEANDISLNAADISSAVLVGDNDYTDNIFYAGGSSGNIAVDNLCNRIAKTITRGKLVHIPHTGNSTNSGIPMGGRAELVSTDGTTTGNGALDKYAIKYLTSISPIGDEQMLGEAMARVASIHLVGSPLSAGIFENKNSVQTDLEVASGQTFNSGNTAFYNALAVQLSKVLGGSKSSAPMNNGTTVIQEPIVGTLVKDLFAHAGNDTATAEGIWKHTVLLTNDGTNIFSVSTSWNTDILKIHKDTGALTNLGENDGTGSGWSIGQSVVYHDNHIYYIFEGVVGTPANGTIYHIQKMNVNTGTITYDVVNLGDSGVNNADGNGYKLCKDTSGNLWAFGEVIYKIPFATMVKQNMLTQLDKSRKEVIYHPGKDLFYIARNSTGDKLYTYDPKTPSNGAVHVAGAGGQSVGDETDNGAGATAKMCVMQMTIGSNGDYIYFTSWNGDKRIRAIKLSDYTFSTHLTTEQHGGLTNIGNKLYYSMAKSNDDIFQLKSVPEINSTGIGVGPNDSDGVSCPALKSIYEQLMNVPGRSQIMETREVTNVPMPSGTNIPGGFPFITGDKLVMYLRPKINFAAQTLPEQHTTLVGMPEEVGFSVPVYDIGRKNSDGGALTGQTYTQSSMYNQNANVGFNQCFEGTAPDTTSYWLTAGPSNVGNNPATSHGYGTNGGAYTGESYTRFVGEPKDITVTTAKLQNTNEVVDLSDPHSVGGFIYYNDIQVGDAITYEHPVNGTTTTTVASKPAAHKITLTDAHDATANNVSLTFTKKENLMGEWGQVDIGQNTAVKQIDLWPYPPAQASDIPKNFHLLGSADGTNWDILKKVENEDWGLANAGGIKEYAVTPSGPYRYYRISVQLLVNNASNQNFSLSQMVIWGGKHPTEFYKHALPLDISGLVTNFTATPENITSAFPGKTIGGPDSEELKWGWMGSTTNNILTQDTTDITDTNTIDLHVWKITITL